MKSLATLRYRKAEKFNRVILFGGTSEIGLEIASRAKLLCDDNSDDKITRILRTKPTNAGPSLYNDVVWAPRSWQDVVSAVRATRIGRRDLVIISIGDLRLDDYSSEKLTTSLGQVDANVFVNGTLPTFTLLAVSQEMLKAGGGSIVIISSVAAFPVLDSNSIYGASKRLLDEIALSVMTDFRKQKVNIIIARPGFVQTKLHKRRTSSFFSTSSSAIAKATLKKVLKNHSGVIWTPRGWRYLSWILSSLPFARRAASILLRRLRRTRE